MPRPSQPEERCRRSGGHPADSSSFANSETLSKVDWYRRRPPKAQARYYNSDAEEEGVDNGKHTSEAEDENEGGNDRNHSMRDLGEPKEGKRTVNISSTDHQHPLLAPFPPSFAYAKVSMASFREAKKVDRPPHTQVGAIPRPGSILPHSGILLPHYMSKQSGAHTSGTHTHNKGLASIKGVTLIPSHVLCKSLKGRRGLDGEIEPSSPKVTCLGRVKIKHKYQHEPGKLSGLQAATFHGDKDKIAQPSKKGPYNGLASMQDREEGPTAAVLSPSTPAKTDLRKSSHWGHKKDTKTGELTSDSEAKSKKSMRKERMEAKYDIKFRKEKETHNLRDAPFTCTSPQAENGIDLGRFPSSKSIQMKDIAKAITNLWTTEDFDSQGSGFVPQVPPANSLLLMRNSKNRSASSALSSSRTGAQMFAKVKGTVMDTEHDEQGAGLSGANVKSLFAVELEGVNPMHGREMAIMNDQLLHATVESQNRLWQRRCIVRPTELDVGMPIANS